MNPLAAAVDGARWVRHEPVKRRVLLWREGDDLITIVHEDTGVELGNWPCEPSVDGAEAKARERIQAGY